MGYLESIDDKKIYNHNNLRPNETYTIFCKYTVCSLVTCGNTCKETLHFKFVECLFFFINFYLTLNSFFKNPPPVRCTAQQLLVNVTNIFILR